MKAKKWTGNRRKRQPGSFRPNSAYITQAIADYFKSGGRITKVTYTDPEDSGRDEQAISEFLCDSGHVVARNYPEGYFN